MNSYKTVESACESVFIVERSKFICNIKGVKDEEDAKSFVAEIRKRHSLATHNCYAYIADEKGLVQKFSDDGEPQGTAGMPILNVLSSQRLYKTVAVVTRYFGGVKLGAGGLARTYGGVTAETVKSANIVEMFPSVFYEITATYSDYKKISPNLGLYAEITNVEYGESVTADCAVKEEDAEKFSEFIKETAFGVTLVKKGGGYHPFKVCR